MKVLAILALASIPIPVLGQTAVELPTEWRVQEGARDDDARRPDFDDSAWSTIRTPLGTKRLPPGTWLRNAFVKPEQADTLILGFTGNYTLYLNGTQVQPAPARQRNPLAQPKVYRLPEGEPRRMQLAVRIDPTIFGPSAPFLDAGPYVVTRQAMVAKELENATARMRSRLGPLVAFSGIQLAQAFALILIWFVSGRQYQVLLWAALYMAYNGYNNFTFFWALPATPRHLPPIAKTCMALSIWRPKPRNWILATLAVWVALLVSPYEIPNIATWINVAASAMLILNLPNARSTMGRLACVLLAIYVQAPAWARILGRPLLFEGEAGVWPLLAMVNVVFALTVILYFMRRFAADRRERERLSGELEAARAVQSLLLRNPTIQGASIEAVYFSAHEVGGDFYAVIDERMLVVGDVSGKGLRAAMMVSLVLGALRAIPERTPSQLLAALNRAIADRAEGGFITCLCARFDGDGQVTIANAGHLAPYRDGEELQLDSGMPLGIDPAAVYEDQQFATGRQLTLVSDGVVEAANAKGELFGFDRTREIAAKSASEIAAAAQAWGQNDDITVVTVRSAV